MSFIARNRSLILLAVAEAVSATGSWITSMALFAMILFDGSGGVGHSSALFLASMGPAMVLGPVAGWLADRFDRRCLMILSQVLSGAVVSALILAGTERLAVTYLLLALQATVSSPMAPTRRAVVPAVVAPSDLTRANALLEQTVGLVKIAGPMLGGLLLAFMSPRQALFLNLVCYVLAAAVLTLLPPLPAQGTRLKAGRRDRTERGWGAIRRVVTAINHRAPLFRYLVLAAFLLSVVLLAFDVTVALFIRDVLQASETFMGLVVGAVGLGTGATGLFLMVSRGERNLWRDFLTGFMLMAAVPLALAVGDWWGVPEPGRALLLAGALLTGIGSGLANVQGQTLVQSLAPEGWVGRLSGLLQSAITAGQLTGLLLTPLLVPQPLSYGLFFGIGTGLLLLYGLGFSLAIRRQGIVTVMPSDGGGIRCEDQAGISSG